MEPYAEAEVYEPYTSRQTSVGCKTSPRNSEALHAQASFASVNSCRKPVAVVLMSIIQAGKAANTSQHAEVYDRVVLSAGHVLSLFEGKLW